MAKKTVPFSVRIPEEDAEFLSQCEIDGAKTPSDKFRAILAEKRASTGDVVGYQAWFEKIESMMKPVVMQIRSEEVENGRASEIVKRSFEWLPDLMAFFMSMSLHAQGEKLEEDDLLSAFEVGLHDRISLIHESILQLGVSNWQTCLNPDRVAQRSDKSIQLAQVMQTVINRKVEENNG
ncbi:MAG: hypothetical protein MI702_01425 [Chlorobiales bacterium]|nr:hypothetical protein [Chlorobiales bacterium]